MLTPHLVKNQRIHTKSSRNHQHPKTQLTPTINTQTCHKKTTRKSKRKKNQRKAKSEHNSPSLGLGDLLGVEDLGGSGPLVGGDGDALGGVGVADDEDVVATTERVAEHRLWVQDDLAVFAGRLARAGSIVIPPGQLGGVGDGAWQRPGLAPQVGAAPSDPDVLGDDGLGALLQVQSQQLIQRRHGDDAPQPQPPNNKIRCLLFPSVCLPIWLNPNQPAVSEEDELGEAERDLTSQRHREREGGRMRE